MSNKNEEKERENDPIKHLEEIQKKYGNLDYIDAPPTLGLEKKTFNDMSNDELLDYALKSVDKTQTDKNKQEISDLYGGKIDKKNDKKTELEETGKKSQSIINAAYDKSSKNLSNDALKRGLARSSIVINQLSGLEENRAKDLVEEMNTINTKMSNISEEIAELEKSRDSALEDLDISYAKSLEKSISEKRKELDKEKEEVFAFNNKVDQLEADYQIELEKQRKAKRKENMEYRAKYGYTLDELKMQNEMYNYMMNYLGNMSKKDALAELLGKSEYERLLGDKYLEIYAFTRNRKL